MKYLCSIRKLLEFRWRRLHLLDQLVLQVGKHFEALLRFILSTWATWFEHYSIFN